MTTSPYRIQARQILVKVMAEHAGCTVKQMRGHIRAAFKASLWPLHKHATKIRQEETNIALGESLRKRKPTPIDATDIIPSMHPWAEKNGLLKITPTTDIHQAH